jgi:hypothetical protein
VTALANSVSVAALLLFTERRPVAKNGSHEVTKMSQPIKKIQAGAVSVALFENEATVNGKKTTMIKAVLDKRYKDAQSGEWRSTRSLNRTEVFLAIHALQRAVEAMIEMGRSDDNGQQPRVEEEFVE